MFIVPAMGYPTSPERGDGDAPYALRPRAPCAFTFAHLSRSALGDAKRPPDVPPAGRARDTPAAATPGERTLAQPPSLVARREAAEVQAADGVPWLAVQHHQSKRSSCDKQRRDYNLLHAQAIRQTCQGERTRRKHHEQPAKRQHDS